MEPSGTMGATWAVLWRKKGTYSPCRDKCVLHIVALQRIMFRNLKPREPVELCFFFNRECRVLLFKRFYKGVLNRPWNCYGKFFLLEIIQPFGFYFCKKYKLFEQSFDMLVDASQKGDML